ncbi:unnamed protein product [Acidithrix sp. C25]|nr:unnamed protein product [Acidithrix sp. C25]
MRDKGRFWTLEKAELCDTVRVDLLMDQLSFRSVRCCVRALREAFPLLPKVP